MTSEEIKATYSMRNVVERYGFQPNRAGFIHCPFHGGDREPSLKVYDRTSIAMPAARMVISLILS